MSGVELPLRIESTQNKRRQVEARLWAHTETLPESGCWLWTGDAVRTGHGRIAFGGVKWLAHRLAYEALIGPIPVGAVVMHRCDVQRCWNPAHLRCGTQEENVRDRDAKGRTARGPSHARLRGEANGATSINEATVRSIRRMHAQRMSQRAIAARHDVCQMTVSNIVRRKTWGHIE